MTFPTEVADHHKADLHQKCVYLVSQFKNKDLALWEKYSAEVKTLKVEDSWDFYHVLLVEYQKLVDKPDLSPSKTTAPETKVVNAVKKAAPKKAVKKAAPKKAVKKAAPKKAVKKAAPKKSVKKAAPKKAVRKAAPKKAVRKAAPKKVAKKKTVKKAANKK